MAVRMTGLWYRVARAGPVAVVLGLMSVGPALAQSPDSGEFPDGWYYHNGTEEPVRVVRQLEGRAAPALTLKDWIGEPRSLRALRGKIVVVDFWATWCPPCVSALPENVRLRDRFTAQGVEVIGVHHGKKGFERMAEVAAANKLNYSTAVDDGGASAEAYRVRFWPTYVVIDRGGTVRAAGLKPEWVSTVVDELLAEPPVAAPAPSRPASQAAPGVPTEWLEGTADQRRRLAGLEGAAPPQDLECDTWINSQPLRLADLRGKVVLLDFWGTWSAPCRRSLSVMNELGWRHAKEGLVVVGVCHPRQVESMADLALTTGISQPVCADSTGAITRAFRVNGFPDYYLIDRSGRLVIADCVEGHLEAAVTRLLKEGR